MQAFIEIIREMFSYLILINALFLQGVWIYLGRKGEEAYIDDLINFRPPNSTLSRFYGWRVSNIANAVTEGVGFIVALLLTIVGLAALAGDIMILIPLVPILIFVVFMSLISVVQMTRRVTFVVQKEAEVSKRLTAAEFKIEEAQNLVDSLSSAGQFADGRLWFVLFRISARKDPVGYAVRDVLIEKGKSMLRQLKAEDARRVSDKSPSSGGPDIE
ncbi:MAG: hypothetical protein EAX95_00710 [Candidatus Thorarchaeota archaeon]|nr:hypothetical protein [Candidatus Thorarchaeota archaeon]